MSSSTDAAMRQLSRWCACALLTCTLASCSPNTNSPIVAATFDETISSANQPKQPSSRDATDESSLSRTIGDILRNNLERRSLSAETNGAWQVIHGAVAYGEQLPMQVDGNTLPAFEYLFSGGSMNGWDLSTGPTLPVTGRPGIIARVEAGSYIGQGHADQWLGYFSQANIPLDRKVKVGNQTLTILDWARQAQWDVPTNQFKEYSWTLIALTNYFPSEEKWQGSDGNTWSLESLVRFEAEQDLSESACGGMHRLMGLAHAVRFRKRNGGLFDGGWAMAKRVVDDSIQRARQFQNSDGSFSTHYSARPGNSNDLSVCISATGHTFEFLAYALDESELAKPWMEKAAGRLCAMLQATENIDLECGGAYHALSGLKLYQQRRASPIFSK
jgi:hypothetical protein